MKPKRQRVHGIKPGPRVPVIRWLGAFRGGYSFEDSLNYELTLKNAAYAEVAAEIIRFHNNGHAANGTRARIGLLVDQSATKLVRAYRYDAWTERDSVHPSSGRLFAARPANFVTKWEELHAIANTVARNWHTEVNVANPSYKAIVIDGTISGKTYRKVMAAVKRYGLRLIRLNELSRDDA